MAGRSTQWRSRSIYALAAIAVLALAWTMLRPRPIDVDAGTVTRGALAVTVAQQGEVRVRDRYVVTVPVAGRLARVLISHRYNCLPLLPSDPGGVQQELVV